VSARDIIFWMNLVKASPATNWCGYAPGYFPDLIKSYTAVNPTTVKLTFDKAYDPEWVLYNVLSQITPMPLAWDRTSLSQPAPTSDTGNLPDSQGKAKAEAVYTSSRTKARTRARGPRRRSGASSMGRSSSRASRPPAR
jgi:peptide/nickel transport system substrate-binding protein